MRVVFTLLGESDIGRLVEAFGLGGVRDFHAIAAGTINSNFLVATERGQWFLRINEGKSEADVAWEARVVTALAAAGVTTPAPLLANDGRPYAPFDAKWVSAFPWRTGRYLVAGEITIAIAGELGTALAELHRAALALPADWRRVSIYDLDHLAARFERITATGDPALAHAISVLREELAFARDPARGRATHGLIHGDLFRDNVLWDGGRITAILDFEQASGGSLAYDLAVCINDWCWDGAPRIDLAAALVAGYQRTRPLTAADRVALPIEIRAAAMRFTITRITDVYLAKVDNADKDFRAFLARCEAWRGPALGQLTSAV